MGRMGLEEGGFPAGKVKKCPGDTFLARGRVHRQQSAVRQDCEMLSIICLRRIPLGILSFYFVSVMGLEEGGRAKRRGNLPVRSTEVHSSR